MKISPIAVLFNARDRITWGRYSAGRFWSTACPSGLRLALCVYPGCFKVYLPERLFIPFVKSIALHKLLLLKFFFWWPHCP